jgi:hypothetical protein
LSTKFLQDEWFLEEDFSLGIILIALEQLFGRIQNERPFTGSSYTISVNNYREYPNGGKEHEVEGRREIEVHGIEGSYLLPHKRL